MAIWPLVDLPQGGQSKTDRVRGDRCLGPGYWGRNSGSASQQLSSPAALDHDGGRHRVALLRLLPFLVSCCVFRVVSCLSSAASLICAYPEPSSDLHPFLSLPPLLLAVDLLLFCWEFLRRPPQYSPEPGGQTKRKNQNSIDRSIKHHSAERTERGEAINRQIGCP